MDKPPALIVPEEREPTYLNKHLVTGAKVGLIAGLTAILGFDLLGSGLLTAAETSTFGTFLAGGVAGAAAAVGSAIGSVRCKEHIVRNKQTGKPLNPPSLFNEGMAQGVLNGVALTLGALTIAALTGGLANWIVPSIITAIGAVTTGALAYHQGLSEAQRMGQRYMMASYNQSNQLEHKGIGQLLEDLSIDKAKGAQPEHVLDTIEEGVSAAEAALLEDRMKSADRPRNWRKEVRQQEASPRELSV